MKIMVGSARIDENGKITGGAAGDQTGKEVSVQAWYRHKKGWRVFRALNAAAAARIAAAMQAACDNANIGYDQHQRNTLYAQAEKAGFDPGRVTVRCETDCSALVRVCCAYAGITGLPANFRTGNMPANLLSTGAFVELKGSKYTEQSDYLGAGDILVTKTSGHTVVVLNNGGKYEGSVEAKEYALGERLLKHGCEGADVKLLQEYLIGLGYDCGKWGADGEYGDATELAVMHFQHDRGLSDDGDYGPLTHAAMEAALANEAEPEGQAVEIVNGDCWIRAEPGMDGKKLGVAHRGDRLAWNGRLSDAGWLGVAFGAQSAWVSGKYGRVA